MKVVFSRFVEDDLDAIAASIAEDNPTRALTFITEVRAKALSLGANALLHQLRPDIGDQARMAIVGRYAILFRITADDLVRVERIVYGGRNLPAVLDQNDMK